MTKTTAIAKMISGAAREFAEMVKPRKPKKGDLSLWKCECGNCHFRHAGYVETLTPYVQVDTKKKVMKDSYQVHVCTKCRRCFIWYDSQMYDVSDEIDLGAWEKAEAELHKATGPGGEC